MWSCYLAGGWEGGGSLLCPKALLHLKFQYTSPSHQGFLNKTQVLLQKGGASESSFLMSPQVMPVLLFHRPHLGWGRAGGLETLTVLLRIEGA